MIDKICGYRPGRPTHSPRCDAHAHETLAAEVTDSIDPPIYRALARDHELCAIYPCADCRGNNPALV
jgi:hypothetical protein